MSPGVLCLLTPLLALAAGTPDEAQPCPDGMTRGRPGQACCWPEQRYSEVTGGCEGRVVCPEGFRPRGEGCWRDVSAGLVEWVHLAGGRFEMGYEATSPDARPSHSVELSGFEIARTETTVAAYRACVEAGACEEPTLRHGAPTRAGGLYTYGKPDGDLLPVSGVTWAQARAFCRWVGGDLPTEAQWEFAARSGGKRRIYPWGKKIPICSRVVHDPGGDTGPGCGEPGPAKVCSRPAGSTDQRLCDMAGNLFEWTRDLYAADYYARSPEREPTGPEVGEDRTARGGAWNFEALFMRVANRFAVPPETAAHYLGFRCMREEQL